MRVDVCQAASAPTAAPLWEISQCPFPVSHAACVCSTFGMRFVTKCLSRCGLVAQNMHPNVPQYLTGAPPGSREPLRAAEDTILHHTVPCHALRCPATPCAASRSLPMEMEAIKGSNPNQAAITRLRPLHLSAMLCLWDLPDGAWLWGLPTHSAVAVGRIRFHHRGRIQIRPINSLHCSIECAIPVPRIARPNSGIRPGQLGQPRAARRLPRPSLDPRRWPRRWAARLAPSLDAPRHMQESAVTSETRAGGPSWPVNARRPPPAAEKTHGIPMDVGAWSVDGGTGSGAPKYPILQNAVVRSDPILPPSRSGRQLVCHFTAARII